MRKGTLLLFVAAMFLMLGVVGAVQAATLEPTESGAPSAIVIFPVGNVSNPGGSAMAPVAFNHLIHEKWMKKADLDCMVCHHTGDAVACTTCHTVQGKAEGNFVTLYDAMHTPTVTPRSEDTPSSCISCHQKITRQRQCAGCHTQLVEVSPENTTFCKTCHTITPAMTTAQMAEGMENRLSPGENEELAAETVLARPKVQYWSAMSGPYKVAIDALADQYKPAIFNHRHHVLSMMDNVKNSELAATFHVDPATMCVTCHHNSPASATPPKCISCHTPQINVANPATPRLMAAFHLQCMSCHTDMQVGRPRSTDCTTCHKLNPADKVVAQGGEN